MTDSGHGEDNSAVGDLASVRDIAALVRELDAVQPHELMRALSARLQRQLGVQSCTLLLADYAERSLEPVSTPGGSVAPGQQAVDGTEAGRAFRTQQPVALRVGDEHVLYLPMSVRAERIGVLQVCTAEQLPAGDQRYLAGVAQMLGYLIVAARRYTDQFERVRRRRDLALAAEIQWELLPVLAYDCAQYSIAGSLEPAYEIGGDTFDYAVEPHRITLVITDAMGHGLQAALMGSLAIVAMRNQRRENGGLVSMVREASARLIEQFPTGAFVTAMLIQLDYSGRGVAINAGHPLPLRLRSGRVETLELQPDPPLGTLPDATYRTQPVAMEPGDRLLLVSDGIIEACPVGGEEFGERRIAQLLSECADLSPAETVRALTRAAITHRAGELADDATAVCLDWHG